MFVVINQCLFVLPLRTDCHALLATALAGTASATHHDRPLARVWAKIAHVVGEGLASIVHKSHLAIGVSKKSMVKSSPPSTGGLTS